MPSAEILAVLCLGLACWAIGASLAAWKWRRSYLGALKAYRSFLELKIARTDSSSGRGSAAGAQPQFQARPSKSEPHVKAARTRLKRERERVLAKMKELQAELHAKELGW